MSDATLKTLEVTRTGGRLDVTLARPEVRNAFDDTLIVELTRVLEEAASDPDLRVLVLRGAGKVFCAGADLNWMKAAASHGMDENVRDAMVMGGLFKTLEAMPCPTVSIVQGAALGGGTGLVAATDIAIVAEDAKFGFTEVRLGIAPAVISAFVLRRIGRGAARRYFSTGEIFDGRRAEAIGLASEAVPAEALEEVAEKVIAQILSVGPAATRASKALVEQVLDRPIDAAVADCARLIAELRASDEGREGMSAFLEKRKPNWIEESAS